MLRIVMPLTLNAPAAGRLDPDRRGRPGEDGLVGYCRGLALRSDAAGAMMLRVVMPLTLNAPAVGALGAYKTEAEVH